MNWYFRNSLGTIGPLTETQLKERLIDAEETAEVRQGESAWVKASAVHAKFERLEKEGVYLRSNDRIFGPFVWKRANELRNENSERFDSFRVGSDGRWFAIETWSTSFASLPPDSFDRTDSSSPQEPPIGIKDAVAPLLSYAKQSAAKVKEDPHIKEAMRETKRFVKSFSGIRIIGGCLVLTLVSLIALWIVFNRETPEERLSRAMHGAWEDMQSDWEQQKKQHAAATKVALDQAATEMERLRANIRETRLRSTQQNLEQSLREEFESISVRLEGELHILEEKEKARIAAEKKRSEVKQKNEQLRAAAMEAQAERKRVCENLFAKVDLNPDFSVRIADLLSDYKASLELRGANFELLTRSLKDQNWLALINVLLNKNYSELPEPSVIEKAVESLIHYDFQILLRIVDPEVNQCVEKPGSPIKLMTTWIENSPDHLRLTVRDRQSWTKHPDGIGWMQEWKPSQGPSVIALIHQEHWSKKQKELSDTYASRISYLQQKSQIGEIPTELLPQFYENLRQEFLQTMTGWTLGQNPFADEGFENPSIPFTSNSGPSEALSPEREKLLSQFVGKSLGASTTIGPYSLAMRWIAPGKFEMGSPKTEVGREKNESRVKVSLSEGFWISETEVTQELWKSIMKTEPWQPKVKQVGPKFPATCVSWSDCQEFVRRLSTKARRDKLIPNHWEFSLPTEAQWELACRGGSDSAFAFGEDLGELDKYAWYKKDDTSENFFAREVAKKKPNAYGLFDMHGNAMEWCLDSYSEQPMGGTNPLMFLSHSARVIRGGSWSKWPSQCRSAFRSAVSEEFWETDLGFRIVLKEINAAPTAPAVQQIDKAKDGVGNMVMNGSFEKHTGKGWVNMAEHDSHWECPKGGVVVVGKWEGANFPDGSKAAQLRATISQRVKGFTPGQKYILKYQVTSYATKDNPNIDVSIVASIAGEEDSKQFRVSSLKVPGGYANPGSRYAPWLQRTLIFTALSNEHELRFTAKESETNRCLLDDVSILPYRSEG